METKSFFIPYGSIVYRFDKHISNPQNERVIVSGAFGIGKTTFVRSYFEGKQDQYVTIRVSPINYSVSSNDNIFELIKADIIKQLYVQGHIKPKHFTKISSGKAWLKYAKEQPLELGKQLSEALSKLHPLIEVASAGFAGVAPLIAEVNKIDKKLKSEPRSRDAKLIEHLEAVVQRPGSYLEFNMISELIADVLQEIRKAGKKTVFIVDDLDRLDPDHIFRILNVLSVHYDHDIEKNKFGFDKVVCICDIANIESIFRHRYGITADFHGYIDKFYSEEPFKFDNSDAIAAYCQDLKGVLDPSVRVVLQMLLVHFVNRGELTIRQILRHLVSVPVIPFIVCEESMLTQDFQSPAKGEHIRLNTERVYFESSDMPMLEMVRLLIIVFGSYDRFLNSVKTLKDEGKVTLPANQNDDVVRAFIMPLNYLGHVQMPKKFFFNSFGEVRVHGNNFRERLRDNLDWPVWRLKGYELRILLPYNMGNQYDGSQSYFKDFQFDMRGKPNRCQIELKEVCDWIIRIAEFIRTSKISHQLGIASA
jgi:hypothetical protein